MATRQPIGAEMTTILNAENPAHAAADGRLQAEDYPHRFLVSPTRTRVW